MHRRTAVKGMAATALAPLAAVAPFRPPASPRNVPSTPSAATPVTTRLLGYVFNTRTQDVTIFDAVTRDVLATKPLGAVVRWLSNEQSFWDGRHIWSYDFPDDAVQAIAIDPRSIAIARTLPTGGPGPAHSLMLTPDRQTAWVNIAGGNYLAVLDLASGEVAAEVKTGAFP
jgi:hypothetical protein